MCNKEFVIDNNLIIYLLTNEAFVVMIVWQLDLQLPMQSVLITTNVMSSNPAQMRCTRYHIMLQSLSVTCGRSVGFFHILLPPPIKLTTPI